jgi:preprotein translocase subunit Sec61beta
MKKWYPTMPERKKRNLRTRNRRLAIELKSLDGLMKFFQEEEPKKLANERS